MIDFLGKFVSWREKGKKVKRKKEGLSSMATCKAYRRRAPGYSPDNLPVNGIVTALCGHTW